MFRKFKQATIDVVLLDSLTLLALNTVYFINSPCNLNKSEENNVYFINSPCNCNLGIIVLLFMLLNTYC